MFDNLLGNLGKAQEKMKEIKSRLELIEVVGEVDNNKVKVIANGNKIIKNIIVNDSLMKLENKEELEDLLVVAINRAIKNAENAYEAEMRAMAQDMLPMGFPGLS